MLEDFRSAELVYKGRRTAIHSRLRQDKGHRAEWEAFSAAVRQGGPPTIPYEQIFGGMWATFASVESLREGTEVQIVV